MTKAPDPKPEAPNPGPLVPADSKNPGWAKTVAREAMADVGLMIERGTGETLPELDAVDEAPKPPRSAPDSALTL